jgi:hypothetical protein
VLPCAALLAALRDAERYWTEIGEKKDHDADETNVSDGDSPKKP